MMYKREWEVACVEAFNIHQGYHLVRRVLLLASLESIFNLHLVFNLVNTTYYYYYYYYYYDYNGNNNTYHHPTHQGG